MTNADKKRSTMARLYKADPEKYKAKSAAYRNKNREKVRANNRADYWKNKANRAEYNRAWRAKNADRQKASKASRKSIRSEQVRERLRTDINFRIKNVLRARIANALKRHPKSRRTFDLLGCSVANFRIFIESQFKPGMTWDNIHLDHIMPCAIFDLSRPDHQKLCFHFSNYQPLFASDNLRKQAKVTHPQFNLPL